MPPFGTQPNPPTILSTTVDNTWRTMVAALAGTTQVAPAGGGKRLRRWTGGWVFNADNAARIVELSIFDGTTRTIFRRNNLLADETLILTDAEDGIELAQAQRIEVQVTTAPTTSLSSAMTFEDL